jgi:hypothetical protein
VIVVAFTTATLVVGVVSIAPPRLVFSVLEIVTAVPRIVPAIARVARHAIDKALAPKRHACSVQNERGRQLRRPYFLSPSGARKISRKATRQLVLYFFFMPESC